jgi:hypothetical protein
LADKSLIRRKSQQKGILLSDFLVTITIGEHQALVEGSIIPRLAILDLPEHLTELYNKSLKALSESESRKLKEFLLKYQDVFSKSSSDIGYTELIQHGINTGNAPPIKLKPYRIPLAKRKAAEKEIQDMANRGIIEPSTSAWCSPLLTQKVKP